ncbi:hypothetical protein K435DRAFT_682856 [Dendrothele bispora CBS 962.96]|uniref:RNase H type-1 domain-containing protein n=1 Tax=Dendrothele bispora (strain CBS 962.96) TaxID=1314807 RepID=A0A4S8LDY3_DENBC|nr:hypothetical protein K435DRAFT_682856 [Dendrothele bispora CBS 962.96]
MWLKRYLDLSAERPLWAHLADTILATNTPSSEKNIPSTIRINCYLQSWKTTMTTRSNQPPDLLRMIKVGQKYGLRMEGISFERAILREMPIWHHAQADSKIRRLTGSKASKCLQNKHNLTTVGGAEDLAAALITIEGRLNTHTSNDSCKCGGCTELRQNTGCEHPHTCMLLAQELLDTLPEKWDPRAEQPEDQEYNLDNLQKEKDEEIFNYHLTTAGNISDIFRVFTDLDHKPTNKAPTRLVKITNPRELSIVATDGSCVDNGQDTAIAGAGVFFGINDPRNQSIRVPTKTPEGILLTQSNQTAELLAAKITSEMIEKESPY